MDRKDKELLFLILVVYLDLVAETSLAGHDAGQAVEAGEKLAGLDTGIDLKIDFIPFFEFLEVLAQG